MRGLVRAEFCAADDIVASEPHDATRDLLHRETGIVVTTENLKVARESATILIAVKPGVVLQVLREIASEVADKQIISLAAGVRLESMEQSGPARFMRAMTNIPSAVCEAATAIAPGAKTTPDDLAFAREMFAAIGSVADVEENQIDAVTALAGSGPAFVYSVIEALAAGGENKGLSRETALRLATQTVLGAARFALENELSPEELRRMVVTPGGTTAAGLEAMDQYKVGKGLAAAVEAAAVRGREMAQENV